jgi:prevent-host-death family protein
MPTKKRRKKAQLPDTWTLRDAKLHFRELVRRAQADGPQRVTVRGKDAVVVMSPRDHTEVKPALRDKAKGRTGADLIGAMQKAGRLGLRLKPTRIYFSARPPIDLSDEEK